MKNRKTLIISTILIIILTLVISFFPIKANGGDHSLSIDEVLEEITRNHGVTSIKELKCTDITDEEFEKLGEAVMATMHPDEDEHNFMDSMMGGEGSSSLRYAHIRMGKGYLGCLTLNDDMMMFTDDETRISEPVEDLLRWMKLATLGFLIFVALIPISLLAYLLLKQKNKKQNGNKDSVKTKDSKTPRRNKAQKSAHNKKRTKKRSNRGKNQ